jgi:hypothetical protein
MFTKRFEVLGSVGDPAFFSTAAMRDFRRDSVVFCTIHRQRAAICRIIAFSDSDLQPSNDSVLINLKFKAL